MREGLAEQLVFLGVAALERRQSPGPILFEALRLRPEAVRLAMVNRPHVRLGHAGARAQDALFAAASARPVARHQRLVVAAVQQGGGRQRPGGAPPRAGPSPSVLRRAPRGFPPPAPRAPPPRGVRWGPGGAPANPPVVPPQ